MKTLLRPAISLFILLSLLTGVVYPALMTGIGKIIFPRQAAGSLIKKGDTLIGSTLIGQNFTAPKYFWGRPSATANNPYNAEASGGSNFGPMNPDFIQLVNGRIARLKKANPESHGPVPVDLVTASGSGLDPEISVAAALYQAARVANARHLPVEKVLQLVDTETEGRQWGLFGEPRVNVLKLNLALDSHSR